jgi:hypothetical protein
MTAPNEFQPLMDEIFREKVLRARLEKSPGYLSLDALDMFEEAVAWSRDGIRAQMPGVDDETVEREVVRRLEIRRKLDERGIYREAQ